MAGGRMKAFLVNPNHVTWNTLEILERGIFRKNLKIVMGASVIEAALFPAPQYTGRSFTVEETRGWLLWGFQSPDCEPVGFLSWDVGDRLWGKADSCSAGHCESPVSRSVTPLLKRQLLCPALTRTYSPHSCHSHCHQCLGFPQL